MFLGFHLCFKKDTICVHKFLLLKQETNVKAESKIHSTDILTTIWLKQKM